MEKVAKIDREQEVTEDDFRQFLDDKKASLTCEVCGAANWLFAMQQEVGALKVACAICSNCGNVRSHLLMNIRRWKAKGF